MMKNVTIHSNDPLTPSMPVTVMLTVTANKAGPK